MMLSLVSQMRTICCGWQLWKSPHTVAHAWGASQHTSDWGCLNDPGICLLAFPCTTICRGSGRLRATFAYALWCTSSSPLGPNLLSLSSFSSMRLMRCCCFPQRPTLTLFVLPWHSVLSHWTHLDMLKPSSQELVSSRCVGHSYSHLR